MFGALARDGETIELAAETDCEIADVDHLLNLASPFLENLAALKRHENRKLLLVGSEHFAEAADEFAA